MPNTYVRKADREWEAQMKKSLKTLYAICDDSTATPETKLGAIKQLKPIQELQKQLSNKNEQISQRDEEAQELKRQLELNNKALEAVEKQLKAAVEDKECNNKEDRGTGN